MAFEDVAVNFILEDWALLDSSQKKLQRSDAGNLQESGLKRINMIERFCEREMGSESGERFSLIPNVNVIKKTPPAVKLWEYRVCPKFTCITYPITRTPGV